MLNLIRIKKILSSTYLCINLTGIMEILRSLFNFITQYYNGTEDFALILVHYCLLQSVVLLVQ